MIPRMSIANANQPIDRNTVRVRMMNNDQLQISPHVRYQDNHLEVQADAGQAKIQISSAECTKH